MPAGGRNPARVQPGTGNCAAPRQSLGAALAVAVALHALLLSVQAQRPAPPAMLTVLDVRLVSAGRTAGDVTQAAASSPLPRTANAPHEQRVPNAAPVAEVAPADGIVAADAAPIAPAADTAPPSTGVTDTPPEARVDSRYLDNRKPAYPALSRRLGEEGNVLLRVRVSAQGDVLAVAIERSSGHARLDDAAQRAVAHWRFVPARRGDATLESTVLVPLDFSLKR